MTVLFVLRGQQATVKEAFSLYTGRTGVLIEIDGKEEFLYSATSNFFYSRAEAEAAAKKERAEFAKYLHSPQ